MFDERSLGGLLRGAMYAFKALVWLLKAAYFCGLLWLAVPFGLGIAYEEITGTIIKGDSIQDKVFMLLFYIACVLAVLTFIQNVIRMIKKDRSFSLLRAVLQKKEKKGFEAKFDGKSVVLSSEPSGFILGKYKEKYATIDPNFDFHAMILGGPGSGKSACCALPSLLNWPERVFAIDIKGELFQKCKKARGEAQIKVFDPTNPKAFGYDPFYMLKHNMEELSEEARALALSICPIAEGEKDKFWILSAQNLLTGLIIYYFHQDLSFAETMRLIKSKPIQNTVAEIMLSGDEQAIYQVSQFSDLDSKTLGGIFGELSNHIQIFSTSNDLQRALSGEGSCITPEDLEKGYDIFCCIPEYKLEQWKTMLSMMCNQFIKFFERRPEENTKPVLFLIDEFARIGRIQSISGALATLRSKKIRIALFVQSKSQLDVNYGKSEAEVLADNCNVKLILRCSEPNSQEWVSKMVGTYDRKKTSQNFSADMMGLGKSQGSSTSTESNQRIIKPEAFAYLEDDLICILPNGYKKLRKAYWFKEKYFKNQVE